MIAVPRQLAVGDAATPILSYARVIEMIEVTTKRVRGLVRKGKSAPVLVVGQQLIALIEHTFCERLPFPRRVEPLSADADAKGGANSSSPLSADRGRGGAVDGDLWAKAMRGKADPKFKRAAQRRVLQQLYDLLQTYLVACIVQVRCNCASLVVAVFPTG